MLKRMVAVALVAACGLMGYPTASKADIYRYVDSQGVVHFTSVARGAGSVRTVHADTTGPQAGRTDATPVTNSRVVVYRYVDAQGVIHYTDIPRGAPVKAGRTPPLTRGIWYNPNRYSHEQMSQQDEQLPQQSVAQQLPRQSDPLGPLIAGGLIFGLLGLLLAPEAAMVCCVIP